MSTPILTLRATGDIAALTPAIRAALLDRATSTDDTVRATTAGIIASVKSRGDAALFEMAQRFDGATISALEVPRKKWDVALDRIDPALRNAMDRAVRNIAAVHTAFLPSAKETSPEPGIVVGRRPDPLDRVGVYAPGGRAAYPSSVLMGAVPARVAGVREVVLCSPPNRDGVPSDVVLAAAALANVDRVFAAGGAGAIAAMAYGTATIPRVDRIVGPGNAYVAEAKLQVAGTVAIDSPAGPSELLVIADGSVAPRTVAREVMAQAEHDPDAAVIVVATSQDAARAIERAVAAEVVDQPRHDIIMTALATRGAILIASSIAEAIQFSNDFAPEHLLLALNNADAVAVQCRNAGTIFIGETTSVAFGDYMTGANHVLPTGGLARSYSGLSVLDFLRWTTYQRVDRAAAARLAPDVGTFADAEGLPAHAAAARQWGSVA